MAHAYSIRPATSLRVTVEAELEKKQNHIKSPESFIFQSVFRGFEYEKSSFRSAEVEKCFQRHGYKYSSAT